jgi:hypothetical protein
MNIISNMYGILNKKNLLNCYFGNVNYQNLEKSNSNEMKKLNILGQKNITVILS